MKVLLLSRVDIEGLISMHEAIEEVEKAFRAKGLGKAQMPPKLYVYLDRYGGDFRTMPAYLEELDAAGVKVVNVHPKNPSERGLPTVMATILLLNPKTGAPLAIMDGTHITNLRTGAGGGVAAKYLARADSRVAAMVGAGVQAKTQLTALHEVLRIKEARVWSRKKSSCERFIQEANMSGVTFKICETVKDAVVGSDIMVTTTPACGSIVESGWIGKGTHINAIGADAPGKQELDPTILTRAKIVVDDFEQATHSGEVNVPIAKGVISRKDIYAELGEVVVGKKPGRISDDEITVFDSTGLAIQDIAVAWRVYEKAKKLGKGEEVELL